jgi:hypothetical protein
VVPAQAERPRDHLGAEARRRREPRAGGLGLDAAGEVDQADLLHDEAVEHRDADALACRGGDRLAVDT